ncbi:MAG TPA: sigma 54-interacting transcriptional regulator, partial [Arachidicoccus sp.]
SAFSKELLESELFGHKAGSFTGAAKDKKGLFEEANQGTIFLDEIGEMASELQAKLLRVLESGEFIKVGETTPTKVNVRVIAATNRDLEKEIEQGNFRSDLYYRLSVFTISLPALRERTQDISLLANNFAQLFANKSNKRSVKLSAAYLQALENHSWKGNIRELKNIIERSVILNDKEVLDIDSLPYELQHANTASQKSLSAFSLNSAEKLHIQKVLNYTQGNKAEAARLLEIGIATLYRKIEEYKL